MFKKIILGIALSLSIISCTKDLHDEISELEAQQKLLIKINDINSLKNELYTMNQNSMLLLEISAHESGDSLELNFEGANSLIVPNWMITDYAFDKVNWRCRLELNDEDLELNSIGEFNEESYEIRINPSGIAPLTASLKYNGKVKNLISISVLGKEVNGITLSKQFKSFQESHAIPVLGLYADYTNKVVVSLLNENGQIRATDTLEITTDPLHELLPTVSINTIDKTKMEPGMHLSGYMSSFASNSEGGKTPFIFDDNGDIRWYLNLTKILPEGLVWSSFEPLANGNFYTIQSHSVMEVDVLGNLIRNWRLPADYVFDYSVYEKPVTGNLLACVTKKTAEPILYKGANINTTGDFIIEIDRETGDIINEWNLRDVLDVDRDFLYLKAGASDWAHVNALWYDENDECIIVSARNQGLIKLTKDNEPIWIIAPHAGWELSGRDGNGSLDTRDYLLKAIDENNQVFSQEIQNGVADGEGFSWPWGQHAPLILPNGNLFYFNNGNRTGALSIFEQPEISYSMGVEYKIDIVNKTIKQVWSYGENLGVSAYSPFISDVDFGRITGNRFLMPGIINYEFPFKARMIEVTEQGELVFDAQVLFPKATGAVFRSERLSLYPDIL